MEVRIKYNGWAGRSLIMGGTTAAVMSGCKGVIMVVVFKTESGLGWGIKDNAGNTHTFTDADRMTHTVTSDQYTDVKCPSWTGRKYLKLATVERYVNTLPEPLSEIPIESITRSTTSTRNGTASRSTTADRVRAACETLNSYIDDNHGDQVLGVDLTQQVRSITDSIITALNNYELAGKRNALLEMIREYEKLGGDINALGTGLIDDLKRMDEALAARDKEKSQD